MRAYCLVDPATAQAPTAPGWRCKLTADREDALAHFERFLAAAGRSPRTRRLYLTSARRWLEFGGVPGHVDQDHAWRWLGARRSDVAARTINVDLAGVRAFYRAMSALGVANDGEARKLPPMRRVPPRLVRWLTAEQVARVLLQPDVTTWLGFRDHVILRTLAETGLRAGELAALELGHVLDEGALYVAPGKTRRDRYVPITDALRTLLDVWIRRRAEARPGKRAALFVTIHGRGLRNGRSVWEIASRYVSEALGLGCGYFRLRGARGAPGRPWQGQYPHLLRASVATRLLAEGMPVTSIAQLLGHESIATTAQYLGADLAHLRAAIAKHPRAHRHATSNPSEF